jgi:hypothetical protein
MDACALAAAAELRPGVVPPDPQAISRAVSAGITAGNRNRVVFQSEEAGIGAGDLLFSDRLSDGTATFPYGYVGSGAANPLTARYVMCVRSSPNLTTWFVQVLQGFLGEAGGPMNVAALGTATLENSQTNCGIPLGMCSQPGGVAPSFGLTPGHWYSTKFQPGEGAGSNPTGNFNWIDFYPGTPTPGCSGGGANELACIIKGTGQCSLPPVGPASCPNGNNPPPGCVGQTGAENALKAAFNSRFGLYQGGGGVSSGDLAQAPPDFTGYEYNPTTWTAGENAYGGSGTNFQSARAAHLPHQGVPGMPGFSVATSGQLQAQGADRRVVIVPVVDCPAYTPGQNVPIMGYACVLLLNPFRSPGDDVRVEYLGAAGASGSPCATSGLAGGTTGPLVPVLVH